MPGYGVEISLQKGLGRDVQQGPFRLHCLKGSTVYPVCSDLHAERTKKSPPPLSRERIKMTRHHCTQTRSLLLFIFFEGLLGLTAAAAAPSGPISSSAPLLSSTGMHCTPPPVSPDSRCPSSTTHAPPGRAEPRLAHTRLGLLLRRRALATYRRHARRRDYLRSPYTPRGSLASLSLARRKQGPHPQSVKTLSSRSRKRCNIARLYRRRDAGGTAVKPQEIEFRNGAGLRARRRGRRRRASSRRARIARANPDHPDTLGCARPPREGPI